MKDVGEVDAASDLAIRFCDVDFSQSCAIQPELDLILDEVLSAVEKEMLLQLLDDERGPFAEVWKNGDYRWNGKAEAVKFWLHVSQLKAAQYTE